MSEKLTDAELAELARLEAAATPGPWVVKERSAIGDVVVCMAWHAPTANWGWWDIDSTVLTPNDGALIAAARNALPRLLAELAALRAESERQLAAERERREIAERERDKLREVLEHIRFELRPGDGGWPQEILANAGYGESFNASLYESVLAFRALYDQADRILAQPRPTAGQGSAA